MGLPQKFKKSLDEKWCIRLKTRHPDGDTYDGVVLHLTKEMIVLGVMNNFEFDGIQVFPLCAIKGYRDNKFERCINQILTDNNQIKRFRAPGWVKTCVGFRELASRLYKHDIWPAVEVIFEDDESAFYIGPVCEVEDDNFSIDCYDAAGQWEDTYKFEFNDVFRMEFGSKYTEHFNNYMRKQKRS